VELSWVCEESGRQHQQVPVDLYNAAVARAKELKRKEEMDSDDEKA
jgi:hypothetical protein